jgi:hypothetical protein
MDKTLLDIVSVFLGGAGVIGAIVKYKYPEARKTYWDGNLYNEKADIIDDTIVIVFSILTVISLFIQIVIKIWNDKIPERLYNSNTYLICSIIGLIITSSLIAVFLLISYRIAQLFWFPMIAREYKDNIILARTIIIEINEGSIGAGNETSVKQREAKIRQVTKIINTAEKLLEIKSVNSDLNDRFSKIEQIVNKYN